MIEIIKPKREDYPEIVALVNNTEKIFFSIYPPEEVKCRGICTESFESLVDGEDRGEYLIIKKSSEIVAFSNFRLKNEQTVWISSLYIKESEQRRGYGSILIKKIEEWAKKMKAKVVTLETSEKAFWAVNFYLKNNYRILEKTNLKNFPFDQILKKDPVKGRHIFAKEI